VFSAYLCCQVPRWISIAAGAVSGSSLVEYICYITAVFLTYCLFQKYVAGTLRRLMEKSTKSCALLGAVPMLYYLFDYGTAIYTDLLYQGKNGVLQFIPSLFSIVFFVFAILYHAETQKQSRAQRERDMLAAQLRGAHSELVSLRQMQNIAAIYRHDMRHHFAILQGMASENNVGKLKTYLNTAQSDVDGITPARFCKNETVNLILSTFFTKASYVGINMTVDVTLPSSIPISGTALCSLLSNGLENAISAAACLDPERRTVSVKITIHMAKLLILIENPYVGEILMKDGIPLTSLEGNSYGARSITTIADAHGGQAIFSAEHGIFTLKIMLPLRK